MHRNDTRPYPPWSSPPNPSRQVLSENSFVSFGSFEGASRDPSFLQESKASFLELPIFVAMGVIGGLLGAAFNQCNEQLAHVRSRTVTNRNTRLIEVAAMTVLTSLACFTLAHALGGCVPNAASNLPL